MELLEGVTRRTNSPKHNVSQHGFDTITNLWTSPGKALLLRPLVTLDEVTLFVSLQKGTQPPLKSL